jgi:hypothetical protein
MKDSSLLESLSHYLKAKFPAIWVLILFVIIFYTWISIRMHSPKNSLINLKSIGQTNLVEFPLKRLEIISILLLFFFLVAYIFLILYKEDFAYYDYNIFTSYTLLGKNYGPPIWTENGRFFPLGHQEWNLIRFLTQSPTGYHAFPIIQLLSVVAALFVFLSQFPILGRLLVILFILTIPSFVMSFFSLHIPERNIIFWLVIFLLCFKYFLKTGNPLFFSIILITTHFALYYKEPVFLLLGGFSGTRLIFNAWVERDLLKQKSYKTFFKLHKIDFAIIALSAIFILLYSLINLPYINFTYATDRAIGLEAVFLTYLTSNPLLFIFLLTVAAKFIYLIYLKKSPDLFWDSLAIGAILYLIFYIKLEIFSTYYTAPIDLLAILYIAQTIYPVLVNNQEKILAFTAFVFITLHNTYKSVDFIFSRKNFIDGRVQIARFLKSYAKQSVSDKITLFFPYVEEPSILYYFSSFLEYKKLRLAKIQSPKLADETIFIFKSPLKFFKNNLCVSWGSDHYCFHEKVPQSGNLIIILPNDTISPEDIKKLQQNETLLFHYRSLPFGSQIDAYVFRKK